MAGPVEVFIAASVGALVPIVFLHTIVPGAENRTRSMRALLATGYVVLAGYLAACVLHLDTASSAFLLGLALDSFLRLARPLAARSIERLTRLFE